jgi:hypothetical protein
VIHPLEYELETARHTDWQHQAAHRRIVIEAEKLVWGQMPSALFLRSVIGRFDWRVIHASFVRGGTA